MSRGVRPACWLVVALTICPAVSSAQSPPPGSPAGLTCPGDRVVWVNIRSGIYHFQGERYFGHTKDGKFMCQRDADREGDRPTHNGQ